MKEYTKWLQKIEYVVLTTKDTKKLEKNVRMMIRMRGRYEKVYNEWNKKEVELKFRMENLYVIKEGNERVGMKRKGNENELIEERIKRLRMY